MNSHLKLLSSSLNRFLDGGAFHGAFTLVVRRGKIIAAGLLLAGLAAVPQSASAAPRSETLEAIHWVENPSNSPRPGRFGELGAYQFRETTWQMHTDRPFAEAIDRKCSDEVAVKHYEWLKATLAKGGVEPTTYTIAMAWNAGVNAVLKDRVPASTLDYAERVNNLAADMISSRVAMR